MPNTKFNFNFEFLRKESLVAKQSAMPVLNVYELNRNMFDGNELIQKLFFTTKEGQPSNTIILPRFTAKQYEAAVKVYNSLGRTKQLNNYPQFKNYKPTTLQNLKYLTASDYYITKMQQFYYTIVLYPNLVIDSVSYSNETENDYMNTSSFDLYIKYDPRKYILDVDAFNKLYEITLTVIQCCIAMLFDIEGAVNIIQDVLNNSTTNVFEDTNLSIYSQLKRINQLLKDPEVKEYLKHNNDFTIFDKKDVVETYAKLLNRMSCNAPEFYLPVFFKYIYDSEIVSEIRDYALSLIDNEAAYWEIEASNTNAFEAFDEEDQDYITDNYETDSDESEED